MDKKDIFSIDELKRAANAGENLKFVFFWGHQTQKKEIGKQCLSQWFPSKFSIGGFNYNSAEQYMMAQKAKLFNDEEMFQKIIKLIIPKKC